MKKFFEKNRSQILEIGSSFAIAFLVIMLSVFFADIFYRPKKMANRGFEIALSQDGKPIAKKEEKPVILAELMKIADIDRGAKIFKKCASCHNVAKGEGAKVGPSLYQVIGRARGSLPGFAYSETLKTKGGMWDYESISQFITKPKEYLPGTKMAFPGLKKPQDRADVILYLESQSK